MTGDERGTVNVPCLITVGLPGDGDPAAAGQLIADAVAGCEWPTAAMVSRVRQQVDDVAGTAAIATGIDVPAPAQTAVYLVAVRTEPPTLPTSAEQVASMVFEQVIDALAAEYGASVQAFLEPVQSDAAQRALPSLVDPAWTTHRQPF